MDIKVELSFDASKGSGPFFVIGNDPKGIIGGSYVIGGENVFVDISQELRGIAIRRGKSRELNRYDAGQLTVTFNNNNRWFDPNYELSPYYGQIVPRREIRVSIDGEYQFIGVVEDWSLAYDPSGISVASCVAIDAFSNLSGQFITDFNPSTQLSGARINAALDNIGWPAELRDIDTGFQILEAQTIIDPIGVVDYFSKVEFSEPGSIFISKDGKVKFVDRGGGYVESEVVFSDSGDGIPYENISVVYGSELLYNKIGLTNEFDEAIVEDLDSQDSYGIRELLLATFIEGQTELNNTANFLLGKYKEPEYRFEGLTVSLNTLPSATQEAVLGLELGDIIEIKFTPSDIPPQITQGARIISIEHRGDPSNYQIVFGFESLGGAPFIIGSANFGIIGVGVIGF